MLRTAAAGLYGVRADEDEEHRLTLKLQSPR
jgi:hypothetical protein